MGLAASEFQCTRGLRVTGTALQRARRRRWVSGVKAHLLRWKQALLPTTPPCRSPRDGVEVVHLGLPAAARRRFQAERGTLIRSDQVRGGSAGGADVMPRQRRCRPRSPRVVRREDRQFFTRERKVDPSGVASWRGVPRVQYDTAFELKVVYQGFLRALRDATVRPCARHTARSLALLSCWRAHQGPCAAFYVASAPTPVARCTAAVCR